MAAAQLLPVTSRDSFLKSVAGRCVGMAEIETAISFVLNNYGVIGGPRAFVNKNRKEIFK
jgi:hypothetical protein